MMHKIAVKGMPSLTGTCGKLRTVKGKLAYSYPPATYGMIHRTDGATVLHTYSVPVRSAGILAGQIDGNLCIERLISDLTGTQCMYTIEKIIGHREIELTDPDTKATMSTQIFAVKWLMYPGHDSWYPREDLDPDAVAKYCRTQGIVAQALQIEASLPAGDGHAAHSKHTEASLKQALAAHNRPSSQRHSIKPWPQPHPLLSRHDRIGSLLRTRQQRALPSANNTMHTGRQLTQC